MSCCSVQAMIERPAHKVLQGFMFLGHVEELGGEVASAFTNAVNTTVVQVTPSACTIYYVLHIGSNKSGLPDSVMTVCILSAAALCNILGSRHHHDVSVLHIRA